MENKSPIERPPKFKIQWNPTLEKFFMPLLILGPILAAVMLALFITFSSTQTWYYPYFYPTPTFLWIRFAFIMGFIFIAITFVLFIWLRKQIKLKRTLQKPVQLLFVVWFIGVFFAGGVFGGLTIQRAPFYLYNAGPYITWSTDQDPTKEITVCWHSAFETDSIVEYGTNPKRLDKIEASTEKSQFHHVILKDMTANTTYYYQIQDQNFGIKKFTTAPAKPHNFTFFLWSDPRTNNGYQSAIRGPNLPQRMAQHMKDDKIEIAFSVCTGDITARGVDFETWKLWLQDITTDDLGSNISNQIAVGNHERHDDAGGRNFQSYYPYTKGNAGFSYSYDYGQVHFVMLDRWIPNDGWFAGDDAVQAQWLENDLKNHASANFTIISMHTNPVLNDGHSGNCLKIMEVAKKYDVEAIFCGHWHSYETRLFNGTEIIANTTLTAVPELCMMIGLGGSNLDPNKSAYCQIDATTTSLIIHPRWYNGTWMNSFIIQ